MHPPGIMPHRQPLSAAPTLPMLLGLVEVDDGAPDFARRLAQVDAVWLLALVAQVLAAIGVAAALLSRSGLRPLGAVAIVALPLVASAVRIFARPQGIAVSAGLSLHQRIRGVAGSATIAGALLAILAWTSADIAHRPATVGCVVALIATALALHAIRVAAIGFAAGAVLALPLLAGPGLVALAGVIGLACMTVAMLRLAKLDYQAAIETEFVERDGRLAAKMVAEFEDQGTGWFWETDRQGRISYLSAKVASELLPANMRAAGRPLIDLFRMDADTPGTERTLAFHLSSRTSFSDYSVCPAHDAEGTRWWSISGRPVTDDMGRFQGFIGSGADLTEKRRSEAEITRLALFDGLTGLANRQRMRLSLDKTLAGQGGPFRPSALFLMDLDRFKAVNDTLGHQAGDALLRQVAQRLTRVVGDAGLVGRLGGDEFQVLLPGLDKQEVLAELASELIASLSQPYLIDGVSATIGCSIGIAIAATRGEDAETLIRNADLALYAAKGGGRGRHRFYSDEMLAGAQATKQLEDDLRQAVAQGGFHLCYQPVVSTGDTRITGFEALLRWQHPVHGAISPAAFIPVAEDCGLIGTIGEWVLRTACHEAARWPGGARVAVNVSPIQFANPQLPAIVASALAQSGLPAHRLELEITEGVFLDDSASSDRMFKALKGLGVRLALDDFGTGYSSLGYLRSAPFDKIKIDQSFVRGAAQPGSRNAAIIKAIVTLAETLGMETTAEGVEVQDEIDLMASLGCSHIQGYVYGRPMPAEDARTLLAEAGGQATASGHRISRAPRTRMLRSARLQVGGSEGSVRIRDISPTGAMIDGLDIGGDAVGLDVLIELVDDQMLEAQIRWAENGRAGLRFAESIDLDRLQPAPLHRPRRAAG